MSAAGIEAERDETLFERAHKGDRDAVHRIMQRHNRMLWRIARGILRDEAEAEDAVQEAYLRAFSSDGKFRGDASLATWLARIVINEALRRLAQRRPTCELFTVDGSALSLELATHLAATPTPEQIAARQQIRRLIEQAVDALPSPFRLVFILRIIEQLSVKQTAAALGIPEATVKTRLHRATRQLRAIRGNAFATVFEDVFPFAGSRCRRLTAVVLARLDQSCVRATRLWQPHFSAEMMP